MDNAEVRKPDGWGRREVGNQTIDKAFTARSMVKTLRSQGVLRVVTRSEHARFRSDLRRFFGVPAATNLVIYGQTVHTKSPIIPVFAPWNEEKGKYLMIVGRPVSFEPTGNEEDDVRALTTTVSRLSKARSGVIRDSGSGFINVGRRDRKASRPSIEVCSE